MGGKCYFDWPPRTIIIGSFTLSIGLSVSQPSLSESCGAYCKAREVRAACHEIAQSKGPIGHQRNLAFDKCKVDPVTRKRIDEITNDSNEVFE